ncbi:hypothetical protein VTO42DRAFT_4170 [Malbranchea cinnamomea]
MSPGLGSHLVPLGWQLNESHGFLRSKASWPECRFLGGQCCRSVMEKGSLPLWIKVRRTGASRWLYSPVLKKKCPKSVPFASDSESVNDSCCPSHSMLLIYPDKGACPLLVRSWQTMPITSCPWEIHSQTPRHLFRCMSPSLRFCTRCGEV